MALIGKKDKTENGKTFSNISEAKRYMFHVRMSALDMKPEEASAVIKNYKKAKKLLAKLNSNNS